jgi:hypothetical protein
MPLCEANMTHKLVSNKGAALAWLALVLLSAASLLLTHQGSGVSASALIVAALVWIKAQIVARRFLELGHAGLPFQWAINIFMAYGPLGLVIIALTVNRVA